MEERSLLNFRKVHLDRGSCVPFVQAAMFRSGRELQDVASAHVEELASALP